MSYIYIPTHIQTRLLPVAFCLVFFVSFSFAQTTPIGSWRTHASYHSLQTLALAQDQIYAGTNGGFFVYEADSQQSTIFSRLDGFSGTNINKLGYESQSQTLIVTYEDGTIDLLQNNVLSTIKAIANNNAIATSKRNTHIFTTSHTVYLSYEFGVVVLDLRTRQIRETYQNLGSNGTSLRILGTTIKGDQIFLATEKGILTGSTKANLQDYRNWKLVLSAEGVPSTAALHIATFAEKVVAVFANREVYESMAIGWQKITSLPAEEVLFLKESQQKLLFGYAGKLLSLEKNKLPVTIAHPLIVSPQEAAYTSAQTLWIADATNGLLSNTEGSFRSYTPNGTITNYFQRLALRQNEVVALPGGYNSTFSPRLNTKGFSVFTPSGWENYSSIPYPTFIQIPPVKDILTTTYIPETQEFLIGSFGQGLWIQKNNSWQTPTDAKAPPSNSRVTSLLTDIEGTLWVTVYGSAAGEPTLYKRTLEGTWTNFIFSNFLARQPIGLVLDDLGQAWIPSGAGGIWVFDPQTNKGKLLNTTAGQGGLPDNRIFALAKDKSGQIWAGTGRGAAYFFNPDQVFDNIPFDAILPIFEGRQILRDEMVTALRIDGGNRKWFGTNNGAWLFDADIRTQLIHFTTQNSPLISNAIAAIEIQPQTGEVFFATDAGVLSYRGTSTESSETYTDVQVFPNPVRPEFAGEVGISGLATNSIVKITDAAGRLVYQTQANGGTAIWAARDYRGRRVVAGIYLIFASTKTGTETFVAKVAVIE